MVFTLGIRNLSFKQDFSNIEEMLDDQQATYAILRYCAEMPKSVWFNSMDLLVSNYHLIKYRKLIIFINEYISVKRYL